MQQFYYLDSKLIEAYYTQGEELQNLHGNQKEAREALDEDVFLFFIR